MLSAPAFSERTKDTMLKLAVKLALRVDQMGPDGCEIVMVLLFSRLAARQAKTPGRPRPKPFPALREPGYR